MFLWDMFLAGLSEIGGLLQQLVDELPLWVNMMLGFIFPFIVFQIGKHVSKMSPLEVGKALFVGLFLGVVIINLVGYIE